MVLHPVVDLGLSQANDVLCGVGRSLTTVYVQEVQTAGSLEQDFLITGRIAEIATKSSKNYAVTSIFAIIWIFP